MKPWIPDVVNFADARSKQERKVCARHVFPACSTSPVPARCVALPALSTGRRWKMEYARFVTKGKGRSMKFAVWPGISNPGPA